MEAWLHTRALTCTHARSCLYATGASLHPQTMTLEKRTGKEKECAKLTSRRPAFTSTSPCNIIFVRNAHVRLFRNSLSLSLMYGILYPLKAAYP